AGRHCVDQGQLRLRLAVEAVDAAGEGVLHLVRRLTDAGENDLSRIAAGLENAVQLAAGNDVEARARLGQQRQDGKRRVRLHGIADLMREIAERLVVSAKVL